MTTRQEFARVYHSEHGAVVWCPTTRQMYLPTVIRAGGGGVLWCECTECDAALGTRATGLHARPQPHVYQGVQLCTY